MLYVGTAPEQKTESAKKDKDSMSLSFFYKCIFDFISARASPAPTSLLYDNLNMARFSHFIDSLKIPRQKSWDFSYMIFAKPIEPTTVSIPDTAIERLLIAPSISPSSIALAVPIAWEAVPIAIPFAIG